MGTQPQRQSERLVVGITGRIGSGKTTIGKFLESNYSFQYLRYSAVLEEWRLPDSHSKAQLQKVGWEVMAGGMQTELNRLLIARIASEKDAAIDGLRHPIDYDSLSDRFASSFHLIYVECATEHRWNHLKERRRYADRTAFERADSEPVEQNIESLRLKAQVVIRNEGSVGELYREVDLAVGGFRKEGPK